MICSYDTFTTAFGQFSVAIDDHGAVVATAFGGLTRLRVRLRGGTLLRPNQRACAPVRAQVIAYGEGRRREFDLKLAPTGTTFQQQVWSALASIPWGHTRTYGQLAAQLGRPAAARAVGGALGANPICLLLPCHRVIGANGSLTGFAFGESLKRRLLAHERHDP